MKRIIFISAIFIILIHPVFAEMPLVNGTMWKNMSYQEKLFYLVGFTNGMAVAIPYMDPSKAESLMYKYFSEESKDRSFNNCIQALDKFYSDDKNAPIAPYFALEIIVLQKKGATEEEINEIKKMIIETNP